jgi:hypothetical protein
MAIADQRKNFGLEGLLEKDPARNPVRRFEKRFQVVGANFSNRLHDPLPYRCETEGIWVA